MEAVEAEREGFLYEICTYFSACFNRDHSGAL